MRTARCVCLSLLILVNTRFCVAAEPPPQVRANIAEQEEIWVGQRVTLVVELLTPGTFASTPNFDLPRIAGVVLMPPSESPTVGSETIKEISFTTQRHELSAFAQRSGDIEIPPFAVRFASAPAFGKPPEDHTVMTKQLKFNAQMPPGAEGLSLVITTSNLIATESWDPQPAAKPVPMGSAFTRTITLEASDIPGMILPAFPHQAPPGMSAYARTPIVEDKSNRGVTTGRRVDQVTFVCESSGTFELPALAIAWWDPQERQLKRVELAGQKFEVAASSQSAPVTAESPTTISARSVMAIIALTVVGGVVLALAIRTRRRPKATHAIEAARFAEFEQACRAGDAHATLSALYSWLDQACSMAARSNVADLEACADDAACMTEIRALESACYARAGAPGQWSPTRLLHEMHRWRRNLKKPKASVARATLSLLNP